MAKKCGVPLEGLGHKLIAKPIFRIKPSKKDPEVCNKCENIKLIGIFFI